MNRIIGLLSGIVLVWAGSAFCNPPFDIRIARTGTRVDISVIHPTTAPTEHYVQRVAILKNGQSAGERVFTAQSSAQSQDFFHNITGLKVGDILGVSAYCSKYGSLSKDISVR